MKKGFTILEILLYVGMSSVMLFIFSMLLSTLLVFQEKSETIALVDQQGVQITEFIAQTIRNSQDVISPVPGAGAVSLSLDVVDAAKDPTVFDELAGVMRVREGTPAGTPINLSTQQVAVSGLTFENLSGASGAQTIWFEFTLSRSASSARQEHNYTNTFSGSAVVR
jgi:type II secretory pathway pseudopilin PulG